jgi:hypothetical protein
VGKLLKTEGMLLLTTCCQGGSVGAEALNLRAAAAANCGRPSGVEEMAGQLRSAGYREVEIPGLTPTDSFYAFRARLA